MAISESRRNLLQTLETEAQKTYDKAVMSLSGGALGLSFAFVKDVGPLDEASAKLLLMLAWAAWGVSLALILSSHFTSVLSMRAESAGSGKEGFFDTLTEVCNVGGGLSFIAGVVLLVLFVFLNLGV